MKGCLTWHFLKVQLIANFISVAILSVFHSLTNSTDRSFKERMLSNKQEAETHIVLEILGSIAGEGGRICADKGSQCVTYYICLPSCNCS